MALAVVYSRALVGVDALLVTVEVHLSNGLPSLSIVGLPETAVKESKDRVRGALLNSGFEFPAQRITVNLAPADLPKEGTRLDLPIALGILAASAQIPPQALAAHEFMGELALSGTLRPVNGVLPVALAAKSSGHALVVAQDNSAEAALVEGAVVFGAPHLLAVTAHVQNTVRLEPVPAGARETARDDAPDLADVRGQVQARRALEIAAAGAHNLLFIGPPGTGKSLLAHRLPGILPEMTDDEALETASIASVSGRNISAGTWKQRPFRAPHHTASAVALVGGSSNPRPGEISLAHRGVLFLDELPEFDRKVLEVLREPLETGVIIISRAARQAQFPACFQFIAAMNPCPCGFLGDPHGRCRCTSEQIQRYRSRVSGPLLDRIDLQVEVPRLEYRELQGPGGEPSARVRLRVAAARTRQLERAGRVNALLDNRALERVCRLGEPDQSLLRQAMERFQLSARAYHRILKVARTIADLDAATEIATPHLAEALQYRRLERHAGGG